MLYLKYARMIFRGLLQYRSSFLMSAAAQMLVPLSGITGVIILFQRFHRLGSWSMPDVLLCFAVTHAAFSVSECFARGFDIFSQVVRSGDFDRILVRPRSLILQVLGARIDFSRLGRLMFSLALLVSAARFAVKVWSPLKILALTGMVAGGAVIFTGIFMLAAALSFWTVQGLEIANIFTDGGREVSQYPLDIYPKELTRFFTWIIPFAMVNVLPLRYLLDLPGSKSWQAFLPLAAIVFFLPCLGFWRFGVRHYQSTGS
jgi:ABC-2 type transport system permease protein